MAEIDGKTSANPYVINISGDPDYNIIPILTVGDEVPLLEGEFNNFTPSATDLYPMVGIPDGIGYTEIDGLKYVWLNHELSASATTDTTGGQINGARVSLYIFDENWNAIGGKNLIETIEADGTTYELDLETGNYVNADGNILNEGLYETFSNLSRFCSGYLAANGFVDENGNDVPVYFPAEEDGSGPSRGWAVTLDGNALAIDGLGVYAKEQVYSASQYRANNSDQTVFIGTEDNGDGEMYMYVGDQTAADPNGFSDTENSLYVLRVEDSEGNIFTFEDMPENQDLVGKWIPVPDEITLNLDPQVLTDWVNGEDNGEARSTNFRRWEDIHEDPNNPGTFYAVTTGRVEINGSLTEVAETPDQADNPYGKLYSFTLNPDNPTGEMNFEFLMSGGPDTGVSYDNIVADSNGNLLLQEDVTAFGGDVLTEQERNAYVIQYNIAENENAVGNDQVDFLFELDQAVEGAEFDTEFGAWESSGIVEINPNALPGKSSYLFDVQAHTIVNDSGVYDQNYQEGGQLLLVEPRVDDGSITGTADDDRITGTEDADRVVGLDGNDTIDGLGAADILIGGKGSDRLYGKNGDDVLEGRLGFDFLFGGNGSDQLKGGQGRDRLNGGAGNDVLTGGASIDRFIFATNQAFDSADIGVDTIADFNVGEDIILLDSNTFTAIDNISNDFVTVTDDSDAGTGVVVYNTNNGNLFYNGEQFATLTDAPEISASDFFVR